MNDFDEQAGRGGGVSSAVATAKELPEFEAHEGPGEYCFISYSHANTDEVFAILGQLAEHRFRFWYDDTMETGEDFRVELRNRIKECSAFVLFISDDSMKSKYCGMEIISAHQHGKKIYPVLLHEDVDISAPLKLILDTLQHVKAYTGEQRYIDRLLKNLPPETMERLEIRDNVVVRCADNGSSITIPEGITAIHDEAFRDCRELEEIHLPESLERIGDRAFRGCANLRSIDLGEKVRQVGHSAFRDCVGLERVRVANPSTVFIGRCFENCSSLTDVALPDACEEIAEAAFNSCGSLTTFAFPASLSIIAESAFEDCERLEYLTLPSKLFKIDGSAFADCVALQSIEFPERLSKIGRYGFKGCSALTKVHLPEGVTFTSSDAFRECTALDEFSVDPANRYYKAVDGVLYNKSRSKLVTYPPAAERTTFTIPDSVTEICDWAFCQADNLQSISVPDSVVEIGEGAFYSAENVTEIVLPNSVARIDDIAFRGCRGLRRLVIPDHVWHIGWGALLDCPELTVECSASSYAARYCEEHGIPYAG